MSFLEEVHVLMNKPRMKPEVNYKLTMGLNRFHPHHTLEKNKAAVLVEAAMLVV